jgi:hypothetical protein
MPLEQFTKKTGELRKENTLQKIILAQFFLHNTF